MAAPELGDDTVLDAVTELSTTHARDIKMPNFARWMTIFPTLNLLIDNWTVIYFIAVAIKQSQPSSFSPAQHACTLIGLIRR